VRTDRSTQAFSEAAGSPRIPPHVRSWPVLGFFLVLCGCFRHSPHGIAERYVENLQQFNYAQCYRLMSAQDRADRPLSRFLTEIPLAPDVSPIWFRPILHTMRFELGNEHRNPDGDTAYVPVRINTINLPLWERALDADAGSKGSQSQLAHRSLETGAYPTITYDDKIFLVKEDHHWHILAGFAARDRLLDRYRKAMQDFYDGHWDQVIVQLQSIINELQQLPGTGNPGRAALLRAELNELRKVKAEIPMASAYGAKLKLDNVALRMAEERVPAIFGDITNGGDRPIDELRLAITWYQGRSKSLRIVQREEHSIVVTPIEFTDFSRQVMPFLPGEKRQFGFILDAPPEVQQNSIPYVSIASVAFTQIQAPVPRLNSAATSRSPRGKPASGTASPEAVLAVPSSTASLVAERHQATAPHGEHH
jgi:hypothetical protein